MLDPNGSLYRRLGGYDAIAAFVDELLQRLVDDPQIGVYWKGKCKDSMKRDRQLLVDFLGHATGGLIQYTGRDMKTSHEGLGITEGEWTVFAQHAIDVLDDFGVRETEKSEVLALTGSFEKDIVEAREVPGAD
ncbi:MAG TPA: group 1 truncated hemoglobin [Bryobacteraceae bacterium]|nr:group 1 truncated hemoglobin [Bryobacteraceae bacterium]